MRSFSINIFLGLSVISCCLLSYLLKRKYLTVHILLLLFASGLLFFPIAAGIANEILFFGWILILSSCIGQKILAKLTNNFTFNWLENFNLSIALGFAAFSFMMFGLAATHLLYAKLLYAVLLGLTLLFGREIKNLIDDIPERSKQILATIKTNISLPFLLAGISIVIIMMCINFIGTLAPEIQYDGLNYHLTVPKFYIINNAIVNLPNIMQSYFAKSTEMLYLLCLLGSGQIAAKMFSFAFGILTLSTILSICKRFFLFETGLLALIIFYTTPLVGWLSTTTYNELAATYYILLGTFIYLIWKANPKRKDLIFLCGIIAGYAIAMKLYTILFLLPLGIIILFDHYQLLSRNHKQIWLNMASFIGVAVVVAFPWYLVTYIQTGNPLFPFFNSIFKSSYLPPTNTFMNLKMFGMGTGLLSFLLVPWNITFHSGKFAEVASGSMGFAFLLALPVIFFAPKSPLIRRLLFINLCALCLWFMIGQYARYLIPGYAFFSIFTAYWLNILLSGKYRLFKKTIEILLLIYFLFTISFYLRSFGNIPEKIPYKVAFGIESQEAYLKRVLPAYSASMFLNSNYDAKNIRVLLFGYEFRYYLDAMSYNANSFDMQGFSFDADKIINSMRRKNITHILQDNIVIGRTDDFINKYLVKPGYAKLEFDSGTARVYKLLPQISI